MEDVVSQLDYFKTWFSVDVSEQVALKMEQGNDILIFQLFGRIWGRKSHTILWPRSLGKAPLFLEQCIMLKYVQKKKN